MQTLSLLQLALGGLSGILVGFILGLVGGGGSILAVPLMLYLVGIDNPHVAIGTSALAVAANALSNLFVHARRDNVRWPCASVFASAGVSGAYLGSTLGKAIDGQRLLFLFALLMIVVGILMLRKRNAEGSALAEASSSSAGWWLRPGRRCWRRWAATSWRFLLLVRRPPSTMRHPDW